MIDRIRFDRDQQEFRGSVTTVRDERVSPLSFVAAYVVGRVDSGEALISIPGPTAVDHIVVQDGRVDFALRGASEQPTASPSSVVVLVDT